MTTETIGGTTDNVRVLGKPKTQTQKSHGEGRDARRERWADGFFELEAPICDMVRAADLALYVYQDECPKPTSPISEDGATVVLVLEMLADKAKALKAQYRQHFHGNQDDESA